VSGQLHAPTALPPEIGPPVRIGLEAGWTQELVWTAWRKEKLWLYRDSNPATVEPVFSRHRCVVWDIPPCGRLKSAGALEEQRSETGGVLDAFFMLFSSLHYFPIVWMEATRSLEVRFAFTGLQDVVWEKNKLYLGTAPRSQILFVWCAQTNKQQTP
jgi:hypothetical protein